MTLSMVDVVLITVALVMVAAFFVLLRSR